MKSRTPGRHFGAVAREKGGHLGAGFARVPLLLTCEYGEIWRLGVHKTAVPLRNSLAGEESIGFFCCRCLEVKVRSPKI